MHETFRIKKLARNVILLCLLFFIAMGVFSAFVFSDRKVPHPWIGAFVIGCFWSCCAVACFWYLLVCWKSRLIVEGDRVTKIGVIGTKDLVLGDVVEVRWRTWPQGGSLVLKSFGTRMTIDFNEYTTDQRDRLVRHFRDRLGRSSQVGWELFAFRITSGETKERVPEEGDVVVTRRRWDRLFLWMIPLFLATGALLAWQSGHWGMIVIPFVPLTLLWTVSRITTPARGLIAPRLSKEEWPPGILRMWVGIVLFLPIMLAIKWLFPERGSQDTAVRVAAVLISIYFFIESIVIDRWVRRRTVEKARAAAIARGEDPEPQ